MNENLYPNKIKSESLSLDSQWKIKREKLSPNNIINIKEML